MAKAAVKEVATVSGTALVAVEHDGVMYGPGKDDGDQLDLTPKQAQALIDVGAVKVNEAAEPEAKK